MRPRFSKGLSSSNSNSNNSRLLGNSKLVLSSRHSPSPASHHNSLQSYSDKDHSRSNPMLSNNGKDRPKSSPKVHPRSLDRSYRTRTVSLVKDSQWRQVRKDSVDQP